MKSVFIFLMTVLFAVSCTMEPVSTTDKTPGIKKSKEVFKDVSGIGDGFADNLLNVGDNSYGREILITEASQINFNNNQPAEDLAWSLERRNLNERNKRWNDPNKVSYIYLLSDMGTIIGYFPIKGKVSSVNSKLTATNQLVFHDYSFEDNVTGVVESPSMDGSYGSNGDAVFFYLTDGTYMEWAGKYLLCDNYVKLTQKPVLTYDVTE